MKSHRQIFRASAIVGGASAITIVVGILRVKLLAVLLGPVGVGLVGLYQSIMNSAATLAGCGLGNSGVRQLAAAQDDLELITLVRRALTILSVLLGMLGMLSLWLAREPVAKLIFNDAAHAADVGWLGIGVFLAILAASQTALLQGMRRLGDFAKANILSALAGLVAGILPVWWLGEGGVVWFVVTAPAASIVFTSWYAAKLTRGEVVHDWHQVRKQWEGMLALGIPLMAASLLTLVSQLVARTLIMRDLGLEASGLFQAAWVISMTYIGFVLGAMGADYFPRLTAIIHDRKHAIRVVNEQTEMVLLLAGPVLLAMLTLAPWVIELLYTKSFAPAAEILRWQVLGDILKVMGWPMGFIVLAQGRGGVFIATQLNWNVIYLLCLWLGMERFGLLAAGVGFFIAYVFQVGLGRFVVGKLIGYSAVPGNLWLFFSLLLAGIAIQGTNEYVAGMSYIVGGVLTMIMGGYSVWRLDRLLDLRCWLRETFRGRKR